MATKANLAKFCFFKLHLFFLFKKPKFASALTENSSIYCLWLLYVCISQVEPALALWMMTAGVSLLLTTTVAFIAIVAKRSTKTDSADQEGRTKIISSFHPRRLQFLSKLASSGPYGPFLAILRAFNIRFYSERPPPSRPP